MAVALIAGVVLGGWLLPGVALLLPHGWSLMQPNTALGMLLGVASLTLTQPERSDRDLRGGAVGAIAMITLAVLALIEHAGLWSSGVAWILADGEAVHQMSLQTSLFLMLLGLPLFMIRARKSVLAALVDLCTLSLLVLVLVILAGYCFGATELFGQSAKIRTSPQTLICMALLTFVTLTRRAEFGYFSVLVGLDIGSRIARNALPFFIVLPFTLVFLGDYAKLSGWLSASYASALTAATTSILFFCLLIVLARRINDLERNLRDMSLIDAHTNTFNRRGFDLLGEQALREADRSETEISVLFFDLDGLKQANDSFGHEVGSRFLLDVAYILRSNFRGSDIVARLGGDEFAVVSHGGASAAKAAMRRVEWAVDSMNKSGNRPYDVSFSVGTATSRPFDEETFDELVARADKLMYEQKRKKKQGTKAA